MINCVESTIAGPVDDRVVHRLEGYLSRRLDRTFKEALPMIHGAIPIRQFFATNEGEQFRVGRILTLLDSNSNLRHFEPSTHTAGRDIRVERSILTLVAEESRSCKYLFAGERLIPFAALYRGESHPDEWSLVEADCDLLCFDYDTDPPQIVVWHARKAEQEYFRYAEREIYLDDDPRAAESERVPYENFTTFVAPSFLEFSKMLRDAPTDRDKKPS